MVVIHISSMTSWSSLMILGVMTINFSMCSNMVLFDPLSTAMMWLVAGSCVLPLTLGSNVLHLWWVVFITCTISFSTGMLLSFYMVFELSLIPILLMVMFQGGQPERLSASMYFLMYTVLFSIPFLLVLLLLGPIFFFKEVPLLMSGGICFIISMPFLVKMPVFSMHFWLPKAHVEASTSGSMVLASLMLKLGSYGLMRLLGLMKLTLKLALLVLVLSILSSGVTLSQSDSKKLIAYSSVTHMTLMLVALISNNITVVFVIILMSLAHGWAASGMFLLGGTLSHASHSRLLLVTWGTTNHNKIVLLLGALLISNASVPPLPSFLAEVFILQSIWLKSGAMIFLFVLLGLLVCYYNVFLYTCYSMVKPMIKQSGIFNKNLKDVSFILSMLSLFSLMWVMVA